jgi:hypothetical protein
MFRRKPKLIRYPTDSVEGILKHVRTHTAAQADQLSTLVTLVTGLDQRQRDSGGLVDMEALGTQVHRGRVEERLETIERSLSSIRDSLAVQARSVAQKGGPADEAA